MNDVTTKAPRLSEAQKRAVACSTCHASAGAACRGSRIPGANTFGGGWGGPPDLERAHDARRLEALRARLPATPTTATKQPHSVIIGLPSPSSGPVVWFVNGDRFNCERENGACPLCFKRAVVRLPEPIRAIQPDATTHVCVPSLGGCNHGFEDTSGLADGTKAVTS